MQLAIIGAGNVGTALTKAFIKKSLSVTIGSKEPEKHKNQFAAYGEKVHVTSVLDAIEHNEIIILAVPYEAAKMIVQSVTNWQNKILVDATNPLLPMLAGLQVGTDNSGAEVLASLANGARLVKAFNTTGAENMANTQYSSSLPIMPVCSNDAEARQTLLDLVKLIGFSPVDMGGLSSARYLEPFAMTWIHLALKQAKGRNFAFSIIER